MSKLISFDSISNQTAFGGYGFNEIVNGDVVVPTDRYVYLEAEEDTVFSFDNECELGIRSKTSYQLLEGKARLGLFKNIVVASGKLLVYHTKN
ncbi:hypothetical protein [Polaribacter sp. IC073]|uniref:hypothetical protein n=1 Tax=Polaribacter sp. IC073 TaxID=2508540 RepID=UPI0011BE4017|nr:hypothetical protein [Polaribacter sp. IC073]TXD47336.1 hypothetical protein ES045_12120 [Polaribacter sp. IC073]